MRWRQCHSRPYNVAIVLPTSESELAHIFRAAEGHVLDTPENRTILLDVANDPGALLTADRYGNEWAARMLADGRQVWTQARNGKVVNGGINAVPRLFNSKTGLKRS
jgi:filamentous hemagglutinin